MSSAAVEGAEAGAAVSIAADAGAGAGAAAAPEVLSSLIAMAADGAAPAPAPSTISEVEAKPVLAALEAGAEGGARAVAAVGAKKSVLSCCAALELLNAEKNSGLASLAPAPLLLSPPITTPLSAVPVLIPPSPKPTGSEGAITAAPEPEPEPDAAEAEAEAEVEAEAEASAAGGSAVGSGCLGAGELTANMTGELGVGTPNRVVASEGAALAASAGDATADGAAKGVGEAGAASAFAARAAGTGRVPPPNDRAPVPLAVAVAPEAGAPESGVTDTANAEVGAASV